MAFLCQLNNRNEIFKKEHSFPKVKTQARHICINGPPSFRGRGNTFFPLEFNLNKQEEDGIQVETD